MRLLGIKIQEYKGLHLGAIQIGLQPLFLAGKDVTCFIAILDTRWQTFEKALITVVDAGLNQCHIVLWSFFFDLRCLV